MLKERRRLVLVPRETPLNLAHLRNMVAVTEMGGIVMPPVPAFYAHAETLDDLVAHTVGRILDLFGVHSAKLKRWQGMKGSPARARLNFSGCSMLAMWAACGISTSFAPGNVLADVSCVPRGGAPGSFSPRDRQHRQLDLLQPRGGVELHDRLRRSRRSPRPACCR